VERVPQFVKKVTAKAFLKKKKQQTNAFNKKINLFNLMFGYWSFIFLLYFIYYTIGQ